MGRRRPGGFAQVERRPIRFEDTQDSLRRSPGPSVDETSALPQVAAPTEHLDVVRRTRPAPGSRNHVVEMEPLPGPAPAAPAGVALPDEQPRIDGDGLVVDPARGLPEP